MANPTPHPASGKSKEVQPDEIALSALSATEQQALKKASAAFAKQARSRGEVAPEGEAPLPAGTLFTEAATGELKRHRFSLLPPSESTEK